jgi:hypothetical protein
MVVTIVIGFIALKFIVLWWYDVTLQNI